VGIQSGSPDVGDLIQRDPLGKKKHPRWNKNITFWGCHSCAEPGCRREIPGNKRSKKYCSDHSHGENKIFRKMTDEDRRLLSMSE